MRALLAVLLLSSVASAQPMMMDPSKMSGIPRPDPQVPPGTITVRLIRGRLDQRMPGVDVSLATPDGKATTTKTDVEGRATFAGLAAGPYIASAKQGDVELSSQPIEMQPQMGTRVMLVFPLGGAGAGPGTPDGVGRTDKTIAKGTVIVRAEDATGQAIEGLDVVLGKARSGEQQVVQLKGKTDVAGEAKFEGLDAKPTTGYLAEIVSKGTRFAGKPFRLDENAGSRVVITVREISSDTSKLKAADGSYMLIDVNDDVVQVMEVILLNNSGSSAFDAGPEGLHIALPRNALQIQTAEGTPSYQVSGHDLVWRGPLPPGTSQIRVAFAIPYTTGTVEIVQPTPIPFERIAVVSQPLEGLAVTGQQISGHEDRDNQGRKFWVFFGEGSGKNGELHLSFAGLPHADPTPRYVSAALTIAIVIIFGIYAASGGGARRAKLEAERRTLFAQLVDVDGKLATADDKKALEKERALLVGKLADVYRGLDELGHA